MKSIHNPMLFSNPEYGGISEQDIAAARRASALRYQEMQVRRQNIEFEKEFNSVAFKFSNRLKSLIK